MCARLSCAELKTNWESLICFDLFKHHLCCNFNKFMDRQVRCLLKDNLQLFSIFHKYFTGAVTYSWITLLVEILMHPCRSYPIFWKRPINFVNLILTYTFGMMTCNQIFSEQNNKLICSILYFMKSLITYLKLLVSLCYPVEDIIFLCFQIVQAIVINLSRVLPKVCNDILCWSRYIQSSL